MSIKNNQKFQKNIQYYIKDYKYSEVWQLAKALASPVRLDILRLLASAPRNIGQISEGLQLSQSNTTQQVAILAEAGLVSTQKEKLSGRGSQKICTLNAQHLLLHLLPEQAVTPKNYIEEHMPIGLYTNISISEPCGIASAKNSLSLFDNPSAFLSAQRSQAQLLWFSKGWVEYMFPLPYSKNKQMAGTCVESAAAEHGELGIEDIDAIEFSAELCSEFPGYQEDWPSDITLWINQLEIATWTSPGDMGKRRGSLTPSWWENTDTQYGFLITWKIDQKACYLNGKEIPSSPQLAAIDYAQNTGLLIRLGVKEDARNQGGINLFGRSFGDYAQDLTVRFYRSGEGSSSEILSSDLSDPRKQ